MYSDAKSKIEPNYEPTMKTVLVLGGAYAGASAVRILSEGLPKDDWRIVLVDRNSHINHVYILPRLAVLPGHEHKGFVPFNHLLSRPQDVFVQASVRAVHPRHVILDRPFQGDTRVNFDFLVYALGSKLPAPLDLWGSPNPSRVLEPYAGTKQQGIAWLKSHQEVIGNAASVLVVGGGALGIQFATDIAAIHPSKNITLLHSRNRLLPRFNERMHTEST
jgi:apoptosis-inducing factor 2